MVEIRQVSNGWVVKNMYSIETVYTNAEEMLLYVYRVSCQDSSPGDTVHITRTKGVADVLRHAGT